METPWSSIPAIQHIKSSVVSVGAGVDGAGGADTVAEGGVTATDSGGTGLVAGAGNSARVKGGTVSSPMASRRHASHHNQQR